MSLSLASVTSTPPIYFDFLVDALIPSSLSSILPYHFLPTYTGLEFQGPDNATVADLPDALPGDDEVVDSIQFAGSDESQSNLSNISELVRMLQDTEQLTDTLRSTESALLDARFAAVSLAIDQSIERYVH